MIITSQLPLEHGHNAIGDLTLSDAFLGRLMYNAHQLTLIGESMRMGKNNLTKPQNRERKTTPVSPCADGLYVGD